MAYRRFYGRYRRRFRRRPSYTRTVVVKKAVARRRRRRTKRAVSRKVVKPKMTRFQVAQVNPFHQDAIGCKIPDANSMPSCAIQICDNVGVNADAVNGVACTAIRPFLTGTFVASTAAGATSWTWSALFAGQTNSTRRGSITSNFTLVRPVAHGVRVSSALSPNTVTGYVHVAIFSSEMYGETTWDFPTSVSQMSNGTIYKKIPLALLCGKSMTIVNRSIDFSSERYIDPSSDVAETATDNSFQTTGWGTVIIAVEGAPLSSACLQIENLIHFEGIPLKTGVADASPAAAYSPGAIRVTTDFVNRADAVIITDGNENDVMRERQGGFFAGIVDQASELTRRYGYQAGRNLVNAGFNAANAYYGYNDAAQFGTYTGNLSAMRYIRNG